MKKVAFFTIILLYALFVADASPGLAVPAGPGVRTHIRRDGTIVKYQAHGDEFLHYLTDSEGNLVVFGDDGDLYIGAWADRQSDTVIIPGSIEESKRGVVIQTTTAAAGFVRNPASDDKDTPMCALKDPIPQRLIERAEKARAARDALLRRKRTKDAPQMEIARPQSGLGQQQVERKIAMIYVKFEDDSNTARFDDIAPTPETLHDMFFNENKFGTVAHFYRVNTNGAVKMTPASERWGAPNDGVVFVKLRGRHENWGNAENEN
ncbi:MAG: hypothetical protein LBT65_06075, partial [Synergistaceae bacterium]|nr:hypothetical protein [Synergistaceae bacterium]